MPFMIPYYCEATPGDPWVTATDPETGYAYSVPLAHYEGFVTDETETHTSGWFCRLSAPGYMDATEWVGPFDTLEAAKSALSDTFDVDPETGKAQP